MTDALLPRWHSPVLCLLQKRARYSSPEDHWQWVFQDPVVSRLAPALYLLEQEDQLTLSENSRQTAKLIYLNNIASWMQRENRLKLVLEKLQIAGISFIPLKGAILQSQLYQNSGLRRMSDIDILVQPDTYLSAADLLLNSGFRFVSDSDLSSILEVEKLPPEYRPGELVFSDASGTVIELHQNLVTYHWFQSAYPLNIQVVWARSQALSDAQYNQKEMGNKLWKQLLSPYDMLAHLCLHLALHGMQAMQSFLDIDLFIRCLPEGWQWSRFLELVNEWHIRSAAYHAFSFCKDFMDTPLPAGLLEQLDPGWLARARVKLLITSEAILADRPTLGKRYPTLVKLAIIDRIPLILTTLLKLAFPAKTLRTNNPNWKGFLSHWSHIFQVTARGD